MTYHRDDVFRVKLRWKVVNLHVSEPVEREPWLPFFTVRVSIENVMVCCGSATEWTCSAFAILEYFGVEERNFVSSRTFDLDSRESDEILAEVDYRMAGRRGEYCNGVNDFSLTNGRSGGSDKVG